MHLRYVRAALFCCVLWLSLSTAHAQQTLYAATTVNYSSPGGHLYIIDPGNANALLVGPLLIGGNPITITGLAFNPLTGVLYGVTDPGSPNDPNCLVTVNTATAAATLIGCFGSSLPSGGILSDITFSSTGMLYGWIGGSEFSSPITDSFASINLTTGALTVINPSETATYWVEGGLAFSPSGTLYVLNNTPYPNVSIIGTVDPATGVVTYGPTLAGSGGDRFFNAMDFSVAGTLYASAEDSDGFSTLFTIDPANGANTLVGELPSFDGTEATSALAFSPVLPTLQTRYFSNLNVGDSYINITNDGSTSANICVNVYAFDPAEELVSCCSCVLTPNALRSLSVRTDLISNPLTPAAPTSLVVELATTSITPPITNPPACDAAAVSGTAIVSSSKAWAATLHATAQGAYRTTETPFSLGSLSAAELNRVTELCGFAETNGSGSGICKSCQAGGQ